LTGATTSDVFPTDGERVVFEALRDLASKLFRHCGQKGLQFS